MRGGEGGRREEKDKYREREREREHAGGWIDEGYGFIRVTLVCLLRQRCSWQTEQKQQLLCYLVPPSQHGESLG